MRLTSRVDHPLFLALDGRRLARDRKAVRLDPQLAEPQRTSAWSGPPKGKRDEAAAEFRDRTRTQYNNRHSERATPVTLHCSTQ